MHASSATSWHIVARNPAVAQEAAANPRRAGTAAPAAVPRRIDDGDANHLGHLHLNRIGLDCGAHRRRL